MLTTKAQATSGHRTAVKWLLGLGVVALVVAIYALSGRPPQMGNSPKVFDTVDALFTAVTAHDEKKLGDCEQRLKAYRAAGELPSDAADSLDGVIRKARGGSWDAAAARLYDFMLAQKREGVIEPHEHAKKGTKSKRA